ncbi:Receptor-type guanylate cyclase gcy [Seminavis robusta]|uniref:Receptor-type guanylate cyclase gcy n=1 Tax=Seminavis robusta TaxID=568900 RepID=A0A9N8H5Q8_9STRA|nr:Receptor-type guanylate cyclase gcy [Seminavis robusta]|eukprot:Sro29_g018960.1 Receptor-type guanylate cyclase gcy (900) ;mRNA; f:16794-19741
MSTMEDLSICREEEDLSGHEDVSEHNGPTERQKAAEEEKKRLLKRSEEKAVHCTRLLVYLTVVAVGLAASVGVYFLTKKQEEEAFEAAFSTNAHKLVQTFTDSVDRKIVALGGLSAAITANALSTHQTFPNVTIENWSALGIQTRIQADGMMCEYAPLVTSENRLGWEEYADKHRTWIREAFYSETRYEREQDARFGIEAESNPTGGGGEPSWEETPCDEGEGPPTEEQPGGQGPPTEEQGLPPGERKRILQAGGGGEGSPPQGVGGDEGGPETLDDVLPPSRNSTELCESPGPTYHKEIFLLGTPPPRGEPFNNTVRPQGMEFYAPFWQMTPVIPREFLLNNDLMGSAGARDSLNHVYQTSRAAIGPAFGVQDPSNVTSDESKIVRKYHDYLKQGQHRHITEYYTGDPSSGLAYPVFDSFEVSNRSLAGFLHMPLIWRLNYERVLPEGMDGFLVVMKDSSDQSFTYRVDGPTVTYLGFHDFHDSRYDDMFVFENIGESIGTKHGPDTQTFDAVAVDWTFQEYVAYVYPSQTFEDQYMTNEPAIYAAAVAGIFVFTLMVLAVFDSLVARRQSLILKKAVESRALISTLYPEQVRSRLFEDEPKETEDENKRRKWQSLSLKGDSTAAAAGDQPVARDAIAQLYPSSSILLMDLAGFTKWSSGRTPADVFLLLETLYQSFDKIALKRGVYKVETIGDCWVGVTGVPNPQDDHAVIMCQFASACQAKMGQLIAMKLVDALGEDTADLKLRVGIHSGPITGGILRGDRGRFQLFGDTINTASRMESNGLPGKVHVSQATADELINHGRGDWLTEREEKVVAKGKGEMTTFWVLVRTSKSAATHSITSVSDLSMNQVFPMGHTLDSSSAFGRVERAPSTLENSSAVVMTAPDQVPESFDGELEV